MLQILTTSLNIQPQTEKENNKRSKSRSGSVPARATTPPNPIHHYVPPKSHHGGSSRDKGDRTASGGVTPAVRPASSMSQSAPANKRPKLLAESTSSHNNAVPPMPPLRRSRSVSKGPSARSTSPSKNPARASSALPVPTHAPIAMPVPKHPTSVLGHGRAPSSAQRAAPSYHPYPQTQRSLSAQSQQPRVYGAMAMAGGAARKASRARRESFKPRPSVDEVWTSTTTTGGRYPGFAGGVVAEETGDWD